MSIAINAIPAFVLVSVFNNMFSTTSEVPRRLMVTLVVFFVVLVNVAKGLRQVAPVHAELMRSYAASSWQIMRKVRVPNAVPYLFTALRIAAPLSVIYAYVSEYFGGAQNGLGSTVKGLELSYPQGLKFLPSPFNSMNVQLNVTAVSIDGEQWRLIVSVAGGRKRKPWSGSVLVIPAEGEPEPTTWVRLRTDPAWWLTWKSRLISDELIDMVKPGKPFKLAHCDPRAANGFSSKEDAKADTSREAAASDDISVFPLAIPEGDGLTIPINLFGEVGFKNVSGFLLLILPAGLAEVVGAQLRAMMPWIAKNKLVDQTRN